MPSIRPPHSAALLAVLLMAPFLSKVSRGASPRSAPLTWFTGTSIRESNVFFGEIPLWRICEGIEKNKCLSVDGFPSTPSSLPVCGR
jgi:hypothetical protein